MTTEQPSLVSAEKVCRSCGASKPAVDFSHDKSRRDGRYPYCKECKREQSKHFYRAKPEYYARRNHAYWWSSGRAKQFNLWNLSGSASGLRMDYLRALYRDACAYCSSSAEHADHIVPARRTAENQRDAVKPSDWENLTGACARCNQTKGTQSLLEFLAWPVGWLRGKETV